ncbi:Protein sidekick-2 [Atta colombica]|uniref:Protein sidekick-2 n=1 Tax=Atta colombica TaxID=520822 RepID=A0A195B5C0_9HYME|nr:Protein sidekick-2 [Atta colombica]
MAGSSPEDYLSVSTAIHPSAAVDISMVLSTPLGYQLELPSASHIGWLIDEDGPWNATKEIITPHNDTFYTVENLRPFTVYSFRVAAINALGRSKPSQASYYMVTLREIPEGKPTITAAHNTSATSIYLAWKPPSRDTIHGEFLGYRIGYRRREKADEEMKNVYIRDPAVDNHSIHNLDTFTQYLVSLQVFNPEGHGPASTVTVMTDEGDSAISAFAVHTPPGFLTWVSPFRASRRTGPIHEELTLAIESSRDLCEVVCSQQEILILKSTAVQSRRDDSRRKLDSSPNNPRNLLRPRCDSDNESTDVQCVVVRFALGPLRQRRCDN